MSKKSDPDRKALEEKAAAVRVPVQKLLPIQKFIKAPGAAIELRKLNEIGELLWLPESLEKEDRNARIIRAIELFESLKPADGMESMIAAQMVATHTAALECMRRAALPNQSFESRDSNLKHGAKLMTLFARQLETLNKHRGKGQQKVTVEHVNVAPGGQAIVGNVTHQKGTASEQPSEKLEKKETTVVETAPRKAGVKRRKS